MRYAISLLLLRFLWRWRHVTICAVAKLSVLYDFGFGIRNEREAEAEEIVFVLVPCCWDDNLELELVSLMTIWRLIVAGNNKELEGDNLDAWLKPLFQSSQKLVRKNCLHSFCSHRKNCLHLIKKNSQCLFACCEFFLIRCKYSQRAANRFLRWLEKRLKRGFLTLERIFSVRWVMAEKPRNSWQPL